MTFRPAPPPPGPPEEVEALLAEAFRLAEEGDWEGMAGFLRDALEDYAGDAWVLCWLGVAEWELGMEGVAYERFKACLDAEPRDPILLATAGNALASFDDPAAEGALRTAAMLGPDVPQARWMYGAYLAREGMVEDGLEELDAAAELDPEDPVIHLERGVALALLERMGEAESSLVRAAEMARENGWILGLLGLIRIEAARQHGDAEAGVAEAVVDLEMAARLAPQEAETQLLAALSLGAVDAHDRAMEMVERARMEAEGTDLALVLEVEERLEAGAEAALRFLLDTLGPSSLRDRLAQRP